MPQTGVLLADDNLAMLEHAKGLLETEYKIVGVVSDGNLVCCEVKRLVPEIVVLDISMGTRSGIEICRHLRQQHYQGEIVFLTIHDDPDFVNAAMDAGGRGYVLKDRMNGDLGLALKAVLSRQVFISPPL